MKQSLPPAFEAPKKSHRLESVQRDASQVQRELYDVAKLVAQRYATTVLASHGRGEEEPPDFDETEEAELIALVIKLAGVGGQ